MCYVLLLLIYQLGLRIRNRVACVCVSVYICKPKLMFVLVKRLVVVYDDAFLSTFNSFLCQNVFFSCTCRALIFETGDFRGFCFYGFSTVVWIIINEIRCELRHTKTTRKHVALSNNREKNTKIKRSNMSDNFLFFQILACVSSYVLLYFFSASLDRLYFISMLDV